MSQYLIGFTPRLSKKILQKIVELCGLIFICACAPVQIGIEIAVLC